MNKMILAFAVVFLLFFYGIKAFRELTGKEMLGLVKLLTYSAGCAIITIVCLVSLVVLF